MNVLKSMSNQTPLCKSNRGNNSLSKSNEQIEEKGEKVLSKVLA